MSESTEGAEGNPSKMPQSKGVSSDELLTVQRENPEKYFACINAVQKQTKRGILQALVDNSGQATYEEIEAYLTVSRRSLRTHLKDLEEDDVIVRPNVRVSSAKFASLEARALASHALYCFY